MFVAFACPKCDAAVRAIVTGETREFSCPNCGFARTLETPQGDTAPDHCLICNSDELYVRKDFPQRLGLTILAIGFVASSVAWAYYQRYLAYGVLFGTAAIDFVLYFAVGNLLQCYRCQTQYRDVSGLEAFEPFNLETHEKHRQQLARMQVAKAKDGTGA